MAFAGDGSRPIDGGIDWETCSRGTSAAALERGSRPQSRCRSEAGSRCATSSGRPQSAACEPVLSLLPLRADVLLSNTLFEELDDSITEDFLRHHTGRTNLEEVEFFEMQVDAVSGSQRVECLGDLMPHLKQMRLNQSAVCTIRDLGTCYSQLRVLWLNRSSLQDLGGITAMPVLEELYISFNDVRELSPLTTHDALQILDVEGNHIEDLDEVASLQTLTTLRELTLAANPICKEDSFSRDAILEALPQLEVLDDIMRASNALDRLKVVELSDDELDIDVPGLEGLEDLVIDPSSSGSDKENLHDEFAEDTENSAAVAELRRRQAEICAEVKSRSAPSSPAGSPQKPKKNEPCEQELIVENLKRAKKPIPNLWSRQSMSARGDKLEKRPFTAFFPDRRELKTAWSCSGSSTTYRPGTASSATFSSSGLTTTSAAHCAEDADLNASDLTMGDGGSALAGNALSAIRRRRRVAKERGEDDNDIRHMLRRFDTYAQESCLSQAELELRRKRSETKRPGTSDVRVGAPRLLTSSGRPSAFPSSLPGAPAESWVSGSQAAKRSGSRKYTEQLDRALPAPTFSTEFGEALIIE